MWGRALQQWTTGFQGLFRAEQRGIWGYQGLSAAISGNQRQSAAIRGVCQWGAGGRAKCGDPGGRKGPVAAWGEAVHLPPEGCVTARGSYWNVWPGDLDLLRLMEPTGGPAYRSTAMVAVIKAKGVLLFASAVVAPSVAAGSECPVFQGGGGLFCWVCVPRTHADSFHAGQKKWTPPLGRCP